MRSYMSNRLPYRSAIFGWPNSLDGVAEVEIHASATGADAAAVVAGPLRGPAGHVPWGQVAEAGIEPFQESSRDPPSGMSFGFLPTSAGSFGTHTRPSFRSAFAHQRELRLVIARHRNASRVNLRVAGIGERCTAFVRPIRRRHVAADGVGTQVNAFEYPPVARTTASAGVTTSPCR